MPRLASGSPRAQRVDEMLNDPRLRDRPWQRFHVKDGQKWPIVWEYKHIMITVKDADGLPGERLHLVVARNVLEPNEIKFFVSNAPPETPAGTLLLVAFSRWRVERCFEDDKSEIGLDQYEGRRYIGLKRHLILSAVSYLFLARVRQRWAETKSGADGLPTPHGGGGPGAILGHLCTEGGRKATGQGGSQDQVRPEARRPGPQKPYQNDPEEAQETGHRSSEDKTLSMGSHLAL